MTAAAIFLAALLAIGTRGGAQSTTDEITKGPVIQNVQRDRATLTFTTRKTVGRIQKEGGSEIPIKEEIHHQVEMTGLAAGTRYRYTLGAYGPDAGGMFSTPPATEQTPFFFVVFGDTRTRHDVHKRVADRILEEHPEFVLHTGDLVASGNAAGDWDRFFEIEKDLLRNTPFYPTPGNHEQNAAVFFRYFSFPGGDGHHYSFDWGGAHFAVIDTNEIGVTPQEKAAFLQAQADWLQADLARNRRPLVFVWMHAPLYTGIPDRRAGAAKLAAVIEPVLVKGRVAAVFAGHDHNYQHHVHSGIDYLVAGGGGAPLYELTPTPETMVKGVVTDNYVRVRVNGASAAIEAVDLEGKVLDTFEIRARTASGQ